MIERFGKTAKITNLDGGTAEHIRALRLICIAREQGSCIRKNLAVHFGCDSYAVRFMVLLPAIGAAWPEPVVVHRACCSCLSFDEHTISSMLTLRSATDRAGFDALLSDMIQSDGRHLIWATSGALFDQFR